MTGPKQRRRGPASPVLQIAIDPAAEEPLYRQVYDALRDAILNGRLSPGARLPSTRVLAGDFGVARNTVLQAFEKLRREGYIVGKRGGGSRVQSKIPDALLQVRSPVCRGRVPQQPTAPAAPSGLSQRAPAGDVHAAVSKRGALLAESGRLFINSCGAVPLPFELSSAAVDAFPMRAWARIAARRWRHSEIDFADGDPAGEKPLRAAIAEYLAAARDARCSPEQVLIVNGAQQALHLLAQVLLDPGDAVWLEDPGYVGARAAFAAAGARVVPVPVDAEGLDVAAGERAAHDARVAYVTPSHQFPLGVLMSVCRRLELLSWARRNGAWIVEDDYDSEFRYAGRPLPCLQGLDINSATPGATARVLYVGTFSKTLVPGLRLGYMVVPDELVDTFRSARSAIDRYTPTATQRILADFIGEGHYTRHIREMRNLYAERQAALIDAAAVRLDGTLRIEPDPAGLHLVAWLPDGIDDAHAAELAAAQGIRVSPLSRFRMLEPAKPAPGALVLGYAAYDQSLIRAAVDRLGDALAKASPSHLVR